MKIDNPSRLGALEAAKLIAAGHLTSEVLVRSCLEQIEARDREVGAWISLEADRAIAEAKMRDSEPARSPLHGIPFGVKDIIDAEGYRTGMGSPIYDDSAPLLHDAACVALAKDAGMVALGKTVTTEFALRTAGKTRNPHRLTHSPGGSSSGSAAAVADFQVPLAIGTQTGGSVVRPASYCGVVGFKPTFGRIPRAGVKSVSESLDTVGVMARNVQDAAAFSAILEGTVVAELSCSHERPRFAFAKTPAWDSLSPAAQKVGRDVVEHARAAGASVVEIDLPPIFRDALEAQSSIQTYEATRSLAFELRRRPDQVSKALKDYVSSGSAMKRSTYDEARNIQASCRAALWPLLNDFGALLTPAAPGEAPANPSDTGSPIANAIWTMTGAPVVGVPGLLGSTGLPVGIQVIGPSGRAAATLSHALWLSEVLGK